MKNFAKRLLVAAALVSATMHSFAHEKKSHGSQESHQGHGDKKGIGLVEKEGLGEKQLQALNVHWFYNWGASTDIKTPIKFVPMIFSLRTLDKSVHSDEVLGFNEPDNSKQSDISVQQALRNWPELTKKSRLIGGPAMAGNPVSGSWLPEFMKGAPKVDFVTVHWYKGADAKKFIKDIQAVCSAYGKPVWVTEFAPSTAGNGRKDPDKFTQSEVNQFIQDAVSWMNQEPCVQAFAWHDAKEGTSALFDKNGDLTETGKTYANAK